MERIWKIAGLNIQQGEKVQTEIPVYDTKTEMSVTFIYGEHPGKTILITSGVHPAESTGIQASIQLAKELSPNIIHGKVIIIHLMNTPAFKEGRDITPEDGKNLNRVFPPNQNGTLTDKIAYFFWETFACNVDFYIDLHGCSAAWLNPHCYYVGVGEEHIIEQSRQAAKLLNLPYITQSVATNGAYNYAGTLGIPSVLIERGCNGMWSEEEVAASQKDVKNILRRIGMLKTRPTLAEMQMRVPKHMNHAHYVDSEKAGCWFPKKKAGQIVKAGELLGELKDYFGNVIEEFRLKEDAIILYQTISYSVPENSPLIAYGHYDICIDDMGNTHQHTHDELHKHRKEHYDDHAGIHSREMWEDMI